MSNPSVVIVQLGAAVANGICLSQNPGSPGNMTLNGSLVTGGVAVLDVPRRVLITVGGVETTNVFTVYGTNASGSPISSTVTGLSGSSGATALDFKTVTAVTNSLTASGGITVGTNTTGSSPWVVDNHLATVWALTVAVSIASGAATYTVEHTYDDPNDIGFSLTNMPEQWALVPASYIPPLAWPNGTLNARTTNGESTYADQPIMAHRLTVTAGTGRVVMQSIQAGID